MNSDFFLTIGITSFNRFLYVKALLDSLDRLDRDQYQLIVVDNCSKEKEINPYFRDLKEKGKIHNLFLRKPEDRNWTNDEYIAKNLIIESSKSDVILFLQDDLQFITNQDSLRKTVSSFRKINVPCCEINSVRKSTILGSYINQQQFLCDDVRFWVPQNNHFHTMGLFKREVFFDIGPYPVNWPQAQEFWGRSEDWYDFELKKKYPGSQLNISSWLPHFAPIWNDPRGGYAFIRGDKRYGHYLSPQGNLYYQMTSFDECARLENNPTPVSFSEICKPIGWKYLVDSNGDQVKYPQAKVMVEGPETDF